MFVYNLEFPSPKYSQNKKKSSDVTLKEKVFKCINFNLFLVNLVTFRASKVKKKFC